MTNQPVGFQAAIMSSSFFLCFDFAGPSFAFHVSTNSGFLRAVALALLALKRGFLSQLSHINLKRLALLATTTTGVFLYPCYTLFSSVFNRLSLCIHLVPSSELNYSIWGLIVY